MRILIVEDDDALGELLSTHMTGLGHSVNRVRQASDCLPAVDSLVPDCVFLDVRLQDGSGLDLLPILKSHRKEMRLTVMTGYEPLASASYASARGAEFFLRKPFGLKDVDTVLDEVQHRTSTRREPGIPGMEGNHPNPVAFVGSSPCMTEVCRVVGLASRSGVTTLVLGESGVGKELAARAIHILGGPERPFAAIDCTTIVETLFESELFGHERGAFTGAHQSRRGKIEKAQGGILFLDEIAELTPRMQAKLLRLLQTRTFERVGGSASLQAEFQLVAATNRDLKHMVDEGSFRQDLYHRLNVLQIVIPPLRERREDIPVLVSHFLREIPPRIRIAEPALGPEALATLVEYDWPGNVRELENILTRLILRSEGGSIDRRMVDIALGGGRREAPRRTLQQMERDAIGVALDYTHWNLGEACALLGISRPTLRRKIAQYGLSR